MDKRKNFYVRLTEDNKKFIDKEAKRVGVSYTAFINTLLTSAREKTAMVKMRGAR
jgi:predicted DNA-binding protein (UPF0251 family)